MRTPFLSMMCLASLVACKPTEADLGDTSDTSDTEVVEETDTTEGPCLATVTQVIPLDGSLGVGVEEELHVSFSEAVNQNDVTAALATADATPVTTSVELAQDGLSAVIGHAPLAESTEYTLTVGACDATLASTFTTTAGPVTEDIENGTYALDYDDVEWVAPEWASAFRGLLGLEYVLVEVLDVDMALQELDAVGAVGFWDETSSAILQGACYEPMVYTDVDFSDNPSFQAGPSDLYIPNGNLTIANLRIQAAFSDAGASLVGIDITGQVDARQIQENLPIIDACALAENNGDTCVACDSDGTINCLDLWLAADEAPLVIGLDIDEDYDPSTDSRCQ